MIPEIDSALIVRMKRLPNSVAISKYNIMNQELMSEIMRLKDEIDRINIMAHFIQQAIEELEIVYQPLSSLEK